MAQTRAVLAVLLFLLVTLGEGLVYNVVRVEAGREAVLSCPYVSKVPLLMVTWKTKCSTCCLFAYRHDLNQTRTLNCSARMMWKYSPARDPALRIYPVRLGDEQDYTCEITSSMGNFLFISSLTVIVPPRVTLTRDKSKVAACQASAGKPAAVISWIPASSNITEEEVLHPNGTVTRVSYIGWVNSTLPSVTCLVTHPATNQTLSLDLSHDPSPRLLHILIGGSISLAAVTSVTFCLILKCRALRSRKPARGSAAPLGTENFKLTPPQKRREAKEPPVLPERIYQNYGEIMKCYQHGYK